MNDKFAHLLDNMFSFDITADLLRRDFVQQAVIAAALLALVAGLIGPFIVMRQMSFAVHGSSELSPDRAAFALLTGLNVGLGALVKCTGGNTFRLPRPAARERTPRSVWCWRSGWARRCCSSTSTRAGRAPASRC